MTAHKLSEAWFHPYAECCDEECGWTHEASVLARDAAKRHVMATCHHVRVVVERVAVWGMRS